MDPVAVTDARKQPRGESMSNSAPLTGRVRPARSLTVRLARDADDLIAAQRLRFDVFVTELGARAPGADHARGLESDEFDAHVDHLVLVDEAQDPGLQRHVVGVYRLLTSERAQDLGRFYSDGEFDLEPLRRSGRRLVELGRSCVHPDYRRGAAMVLMWNALASYVLEHGIEVMFGAASFPGAEAGRHAAALAWLRAHHLAPEAMRVRAWGSGAVFAAEDDRGADDAAMIPAAIPPLIRAYLRLGGFVGEGAYVDTDFNTTDVCLIMDTAAMSETAVDYYTRKSPRARS